MEEGPSAPSPLPPTSQLPPPPHPPPPATAHTPSVKPEHQAQAGSEESGPGASNPVKAAVASSSSPAASGHQEESKAVSVELPKDEAVHHPHHYHHQSHSVRASFKRSQAASASSGAPLSGEADSELAVRASPLSSASSPKKRCEPDGSESIGSDRMGGAEETGGKSVVRLAEADVVVEKETKSQAAETSSTTLPIQSRSLTSTPKISPPPAPPPPTNNRERSASDNGSGSDVKSGAGPSRTVVISTSEEPTHGGRLKEPLIEIPPTNGHPTPTNRGSKACCLCWCCCCSCSWKDTRCLTVKNNEENNARTTAMGTPGSTKDNNILDLLNGDNNEPPPTIEEIRMWGESFDKLMKCKAGRTVFRDFLRCEYSEENILFWLACEDIKRESNPEALEEKARLIYEDYISILSPKEVSLDSRVREIVNLNMVNPSCTTFDEAQLQIYTLMHRDSYPRFVNSPMYKKLAQFNTTSRKESSA